ncbi:MAG: AEC family transporter [Candidatus Promineifilaceae bacterium]
MATVFLVLVQNILPIFIVAAFGFMLRRWVGVDKKALSTAVLYCFSPALVFSSLVNSRLPGEELLELAAFTLISVTVMAAIGWVLSRLLRLGRAQTMALMLVLMFVNGGNYGLTLNNLRYGSDGLARAVVYYTTSTLVLYTVGLLMASMGRLSWRESSVRLLRLPPLYAAVAAVFVYTTGVVVPAPLMRAVEIAGAGAIPVMLFVLGMQMADLQGVSELKLALPAVGVRLLVGPLVGLGVATLLGLSGLGRATSIIEASMPTAVFTIILATEFDLQPTAVTTVVVLSNLLSPLTVASVITLLGL